MKRKICVVTGTRAEYGLLHWLIRGIDEDPELELQLVATGMHLSPEFGLTYKQIENDGLRIDRKVEMLLSSDTTVGISKSMGLCQIGFADAYNELQPDIIVVLGDRFEIFSAVSAAMAARIPVAHLNGGEATEGATDESIRHSITKMSHLHFTANETYRRRVIQLGEQPSKVFSVGTMNTENINRMKLLSKEEFENSIDFKLGKHNLLVTLHPVTLETNTASDQFRNLLLALDELEDTRLIFTKPNADADGRIISELIDKYVAEHTDKAVTFVSLGQLRYLSALQYMDGVVGNSSSGLAEVPSFRIATVNIGDRQKGRLKASSVIDCEPTLESTREALQKMYTEDFRKELPNAKNPYGDSSPSAEIIRVLKTADLSDILKKQFYDLEPGNY